MARPPSTPTSSSDDATTKEALIRAAKKVFASKGFDGATVKDICDEAHCNVALVSYHFGGKDQLYKSCLEQFGLNRLSSAERMLKNPTSLEDVRTKLILFVDEFLMNNLEEPEVSEILNRECNSQNPVTQDLFKNIFMKVFETNMIFFKEARSRGIFKKSMDPFLATFVFFGSIVHVLRMRRPLKQNFDKDIRDEKFRNQFVQQVVDHVIFGNQAENSK